MKRLILVLTLVAFGMAVPMQADGVAAAEVRSKAPARHLRVKGKPKAKPGSKKTAKNKNVRKQGESKRAKA